VLRQRGEMGAGRELGGRTVKEKKGRERQKLSHLRKKTDQHHLPRQQATKFSSLRRCLNERRGARHRGNNPFLKREIFENFRLGEEVKDGRVPCPPEKGGRRRFKKGRRLPQIRDAIDKKVWEHEEEEKEGSVNVQKESPY